MKKKVLFYILTIYLSLSSAFPLYSNDLPKMVTKAEMKIQLQWVQTYLQEPNINLPFSFVYNGKESSAFLSSWNQGKKTITLDKNRTQYQQTWTDQQTGLTVCCVSTVFSDYPVVEWTVYFKNTSNKNTPILSDIQGLDISLQQKGNNSYILHGNNGDFCTDDSYKPFQEIFTAGKSLIFAPNSSGKSCDGPKGWPYYNLQMNNRGMIIVIGWPGQWKSSFTCDSNKKLSVKAGQELIHCYLKPGEEIRTPLISLLFWNKKDIADAQNLWRRYYLAHIIPHFNDKPQQPAMQIQVGAADKDTSYVKSFLEAGIRPNLCWRDAGWYPKNSGPYTDNSNWLNTGTWEFDKKTYPYGFRPFSNWIHRQGMQLVLWFEPERVGDPKSWLGTNHPEWLLPGNEGTCGSILNEGDATAREWLINHIDKMIKSEGIDWYREDMNGVGPLIAWQNHDTPDRQGITENLYVQGHLFYWDALKNKNPNLHIDACASGGRRNDLETMKRAVPLLRSDFQWPSMENVIRGNQGHTYGLSSWFPFQGTGVYDYSTYAFRSFYLPSFGMGGLNDQNKAAQQQAYSECSQIAPDMLFGDYYPLTPYSVDANHWIAWEFHCPETGTGFVQVFRRDSCEDSSITLQLRGLDSKTNYQISNFDKKDKVILSGKELAKEGLKIEISDKPGSAIIMLKKQ